MTRLICHLCRELTHPRLHNKPAGHGSAEQLTRHPQPRGHILGTPPNRCSATISARSAGDSAPLRLCGFPATDLDRLTQLIDATLAAGDDPLSPDPDALAALRNYCLQAARRRFSAGAIDHRIDAAARAAGTVGRFR
jgi:hypothetical protein